MSNKRTVGGSNPPVTTKRLGAVEACLAHNQKVPGSKPGVAIKHKMVPNSNLFLPIKHEVAGSKPARIENPVAQWESAYDMELAFNMSVCPSGLRSYV